MSYKKGEIEDLIFGVHAVIEAIDARKEINKIMIQRGMDKALFKELKEALANKKYTLQFVPAEKLNRLTQKNHQGVIAFISPVIYHEISDVLADVFERGDIPNILVLDRITDVRNFGAIARSAECAGVQAIVIPFKNSAKVTPDAIKTSAGALYNIPVCRVQNLKTLVRSFKKEGIRIVAATEKGENMYTEANLTLATAIIMGSEDVGIEDALLRLADEQVKIPILGAIESLNVSVAASLMIYEAVRQRSL